ncbi:MAG: helix-turn-helix domain-containing protein [Sedimentisphaerales bacterium]
MPRPDKHTEVELNYLERGRLTYLFWGERTTVEGGRPALFWATTPHQIVEYEDLTSYTVITLPLPWLLNWALPENLIKRILSGRLIQEPNSSQSYTDKALFQQWHQDINCNSTRVHEIVLLEIKARLLRFAGNLAGDDTRPGGPSPNRSTRPVGIQNTGKIEPMAKFIAQNYTRRIHVADVAEAVNLHPDYAGDVFRRTFGITLNNFIIRHRVQHAQRMLVTTNKKILEIAFASGFNSLSRFNVSFKSLCRCTPRQYRLSHQLPC